LGVSITLYTYKLGSLWAMWLYMKYTKHMLVLLVV
jgi:hypothetical protein